MFNKITAAAPPYEEWLEDFKIGRKGLTKVTFEMLLSSLKWKKVKSVLLVIFKLVI